MTWATEQSLPCNQKMVLLMLANRTNHDTGRCDPSHKRLAQDCGLSPTAVKSAINKLAEAGYITIHRRKLGDIHLPNQYTLAMGGVGRQTTEVGRETTRGVGRETTTNQEDINQEYNLKKDARPSDTRPVAGEPEPKKPKPVFNPALIDLPDWLDRDLWAAWCDERKLRRKPITERAAAMQIKKLAEYRGQGYSPQEVIEHSIAGGYQGLFAPTRSKSHETSRSDNRRETPLEAGMREHANLLRRIENGTVHEWLADGDGEALEPWGEPKRIGR